MKPKERVFISSTMDLKKERTAVSEVVNQLEGIPIKMELFEARTESPEEVCLDAVSKSTIYVGIFGKKYGFVPSRNNFQKLSVTAMEFEKARELNIPTLIFVQRNVEREPELEAFLKRITDFSTGVYRKTFDSPHELKYWLLASFVLYLSKKIDETEQRQKLEQLSIDESLYKRYIEKTCEYADLKGLYQLRRVIQLKLEDIFVPLKLRKISTIKEPTLDVQQSGSIRSRQGIDTQFSLTKFISGWNHQFSGLTIQFHSTVNVPKLQENEFELQEVLSQNKKLVILGGPGSGKTTLLRYLAGTLISQNAGDITPVLIPLREYTRFLKSESNLSILVYIKRYFTSHGLQLPENFFERHFKSGGCVIMLDGLDEVISDTDRLLIASRIEDFVACFGERNIIIVTSRVPSYRNTQLSGFEHYQILKLNPNQIFEFIPKWIKSVEGDKQSDDSKHLISLLKNDRNLLSLSGNPLMLSLICLIGIQGIPIPSKQADLYDVCIKTLVSSWESKKGFHGSLGEPQKFEILKRLAFYLVQERKITATEYEILSLIDRFLEKTNKLENKQGQTRTILKSMSERAGLLIEREPRIYGFIHLGLRDYLAALYLAGMDGVKEMFDTYLLPRLHRIDYQHMIGLCSRCLAHQSISRASVFLDCVLNAGSPYEECTHLDLMLATRCLFISGMSYGEITQDILEGITDVLTSNNAVDDKSDLMYVFKEVDFNLFENFLSNLIKKMKPNVALRLIHQLVLYNKIPEKNRFCDVALRIIKYEAITDSVGSAWIANDILINWASQGNKKAQNLVFDLIEELGKNSERLIKPKFFDNIDVEEFLEKIFSMNNREYLKLKEKLLVILYDSYPDKIIEKVNSILRDKNENSDLKRVAGFIKKYHDLPKAEIESFTFEHFEKMMKSLLQPRKIKLVTDEEAYSLLIIGVPNEKILIKTLKDLPKIFRANKMLAFRIVQLMNYYVPEYPLLAKELTNFAKVLSRKIPDQRRLLAFLITKIDLLDVERNKVLLFELINDKEEYVIHRRAAIIKFLSSKISKKDFSRLIKLFPEEKLRTNLIATLSSCEFGQKKLLRLISKEIKNLKTGHIDYYRNGASLLLRKYYENISCGK
jgi:energy-coupling factor transporter ATP-binding protein EcfA2